MTFLLSNFRQRILTAGVPPTPSWSFLSLLSSQTPLLSSSTPATTSSYSTRRSPSEGKKLSKKEKRDLAAGVDSRIKHVRYHRDHGALKLVPRPLTFTRLRALRHWTITRAWSLYTTQKRQERESELRMLNESMWEACEELRLMDGHGRRIGQDVEMTPQLEASIKRAIERENAALNAAAEASKSSTPSSSPVSSTLSILSTEPQGEAEEVVLPLDKQIGKLYRKAMSKKGVWRGFPIEAARIQTDFPPSKGWNKAWRSV